MVDGEWLLVQLNRGAAMGPEVEIVADLQAYLQDPAVPLVRREANFWAEVRARADIILAMPWRGMLTEEAINSIRVAVDGDAGLPEAILGLLCVGGSNASSPAYGGGIWAPWWVVEEAARRTGVATGSIKSRIVIPGGWPCPTRQGLVCGFSSVASLEAVYRTLPLRPAVQVTGMSYPDEWVFPRRVVECDLLIQDLRALGRCDPISMFQTAVAQYGNPLTLVATLLANTAIDISARFKRGGANWNGVYPSTGCQVVRSNDGTFMASPGWLGSAILEMGVAHPQITSSDTEDVEKSLLQLFGGDIDNQAHILPGFMRAIMERSPVQWPVVR